jgi:hypothetical protein
MSEYYISDNGRSLDQDCGEEETKSQNPTGPKGPEGEKLFLGITLVQFRAMHFDFVWSTHAACAGATIESRASAFKLKYLFTIRFDEQIVKFLKSISECGERRYFCLGFGGASPGSVIFVQSDDAEGAAAEVAPLLSKSRHKHVYALAFPDAILEVAMQAVRSGKGESAVVIGNVFKPVPSFAYRAI